MSSRVHGTAPLAAAALLALVPGAPRRAAAPEPLRIEEYVADSMNFDVVSVMISGPTEVLLVDAQNRPADARRVAERIAATGKRLTAIFITHPDHDHFTGTAAVLERFPGTPVYMAPVGLEEFNRTGRPMFAQLRARMGAAAPDSFVAQPLPAGGLRVDGTPIEVIPDLQGDVERPSNSALWIASQQTLIAGDVVFNQVHPWLGASTAATRLAWRAAVDRLAALHPRVVVAGHKPDEAAPDSPEALAFTKRYLETFDAERARAADADELIGAMRRTFPDAAVGMLLNYAARMAFRGAAGS